jgi:HAD superfamily hydrolase (TIGR01509 family)
LVIFDCNGVLIDSEPIAAAVAAEELARLGIAIPAEAIVECFAGRRPVDIFATIEAATHRKLPLNFAAVVGAATVRRFRTELRAMPHVAYALTWLRGPKCVASSSPIDRVRLSLQMTDLLRYFEPHLFSASEVERGKPAPDLFLDVAARMNVEPSDCIVIEDSPAGVTAAVNAGMKPVGFIGGGHASAHLGKQLLAAGARTIFVDMRQLKSTVLALRGW